MSPHNPHDLLFKGIFSQPETAADHFAAVLPQELVAAIDLGALRLEPGSFVDAALHERHTDLLFSAPWREPDEEQPASLMLYLLFEHQSSNDPLMPYRMLRYMVRIWEQ